nr:MAG TPA: hypothetical protein [Caudoviricetes sp.]
MIPWALLLRDMQEALTGITAGLLSATIYNHQQAKVLAL